MALRSHIEIRGIADMEYLDCRSYRYKKEFQQRKWDKVKEGRLRRISKRNKSIINEIGSELILSCQLQWRREDEDRVREQPGGCGATKILKIIQLLW